MFEDFKNGLAILPSYAKQQDLTGFAANNGDWVDTAKIRGPQCQAFVGVVPNHATNTVPAINFEVWESVDSAGTGATKITGSDMTISKATPQAKASFERTKQFCQLRAVSATAGTATTAGVFGGIMGQIGKF